jgi:hypothetical protein
MDKVDIAVEILDSELHEEQLEGVIDALEEDYRTLVIELRECLLKKKHLTLLLKG